MTFKPGVYLVGGTILVYEIDPEKKPQDYKGGKELAAALMGGARLMRMKADADGSVPATPRVSHAQGGAQVYGDAEGEALSEERNTAARSSDSLMRADPHGREPSREWTRARSRRYALRRATG